MANPEIVSTYASYETLLQQICSTKSSHSMSICSSPMTQLIADASFAHHFMQDEGNQNHLTQTLILHYIHT